jgi:predicted KAP-like P-loop ATPase
MRFVAGSAIVSIVITIVNLLTFAKVWEKTFEYYGIPPVAVYILFPACFIAGCWYVGYLYDIKGVWKAETKFGNRKQNPEIMEIHDAVMKIQEYEKSNQDEIRKLIDTIEQLKNEKIEQLKNEKIDGAKL